MDDLDRAAQLIRAGQLVAFPTETVYGLGANALDPEAVDRIFAAKGRPTSSPLIVHADSIDMARTIVSVWPEAAEALARRFWPGALTLVLPKDPSVPGRVTAGLPTVGVRVPAHPIALELIRRSGVPIAAPSANCFTEVSPTTADHVRDSLGDRVALILDGGPTRIGIESTVISLAGPNAILLRPGMIGQSEIESVIGPLEVAGSPEAGSHSSPGQHRRHYSPRTPLAVIGPDDFPTTGRTGYLWLRRPIYRAASSIRMPRDPARYAARLYAALHELDQVGLDSIAVERPPLDPAWSAIHDRLARAAGQ